MAQSKTKSRHITRGLLKALALSGGIAAVVVAPNATVMIERLVNKPDRAKATNALARLKYRKLVEAQKKNGQYYYRLTTKGWDLYEKIEIDELTIRTPKRWDKKWRIVMFDIPLTHQKQRQYLLRQLRLLDFYMLQQSVWLHPFDCEKQVGALLTYLKLEGYVSFLVVEKGNFTDHAEQHFKKIKLLM